MRLFKCSLLSLFFVFGCATFSLATGPSSADLKIVPITHNSKGVILFKTYYTVNHTGAHYYQKVEIGWLVVSANGIWEEVPHLVFDPQKVAEDDLENKWNQFEEEFKQNINWASTPLSVQPLLRRYGFTQHQDFTQTTSAGTLTWEPDKLCERGNCTSRRTIQRSLHNLRSTRGKGSPVQASFYYAGVAVFNNYLNDEEQARGASFFIPIRPARYRSKDPGIDYWNIDAIVIINGGIRGKR